MRSPAKEKLTHKNFLSVIIPYYGGDDSLLLLCERIDLVRNLLDIECEVLFVFDGPDAGDWKYFKNATEKYGYRTVKLARNFGQQVATKVGMRMSKGDLIVILDCDLQDPPELIKTLIDELGPEDYVVFVKRLGKYDGYFRRYSRKAFRIFYRLISPKNVNIDVGSFMLIRREVSDYILALEDNSHVGLSVQTLNLPFREVSYQREIRETGTSSYTFRKLINHTFEALDHDLTRFFKVSIATSGLFIVVSMILSFYVLLNSALGNSTSGWRSIIILMMLGFSISLILLSLIGYSEARKKNSKLPNFIFTERN